MLLPIPDITAVPPHKAWTHYRGITKYTSIGLLVGPIFGNTFYPNIQLSSSWSSHLDIQSIGKDQLMYLK